MRSVNEDAYRVVVIGPDENRWVCHYCGMPADSLDHVPPLSRWDDAMAIDPDIRCVKIPACRECNTLAGAVLHISFMDRCQFVKDRLARKYAKQLRVAVWTEEELEDMGQDFIRSIRKNMAAKAFVLSRINFYPK